MSTHGGHLLKSRGEGDSTFSVFRRPSDAVRAAIEAQRALTAEPWPPSAELSVRIAVHTGEAIDRDSDYFGPAVNRAARLRSTAIGGDVVLSGVTADLVTDDLPNGVRLVELGTVQLRGIERDERLVGIDAAGLRGPQPRTPAPATTGRALSTYGVTAREAEVLEALRERLTNAEIGARLYVSARTVESHVASLMRKLGAASRKELAELAGSATASGGSEPPRLPARLAPVANESTFIGRSQQRGHLRALWQRAKQGRLLAAVVLGEAGIGKSRLVAELAVEAHEDGGHVMLGACFEDLRTPFEPFVELIRADATERADAELIELIGPRGSVVGAAGP